MVFELTDIDRVRAAHERMKPHLTPTPLRRYAPLESAIGHDLKIWIKHENHHPTNAFKIRNGLAAMTMLSPDKLARGVVAATRGNHGQGVAWAGQILGAPVTICVPHGNSRDKNTAMRGLGAELIESGTDYDAAAALADTLVAERGMTLVHSTNNPEAIAGAGTITLEILDQLDQARAHHRGADDRAHQLDAMVIAIGGGSQAVGALTVVRALRPEVEIYGVQAAGAAAIHDGWHAKRPVSCDSAHTFADGLATRTCYEGTFQPLCDGLRDFITVTESEIAEALRLYLTTTHNLAEGAAAAALAGLKKLAPTLAGKTVGVILSGSNIDLDVLQSALNGQHG